MDIKELEAFVYVVDNCSFSRAAEQLHLTQPTISSHIAALERKLGMKLIVRTTKETYPSDAGKLLYGYAREILRLREQAAGALRSYAEEMRGVVTVATSAGPGRFFLPHMVRAFRRQYPDILIRTRVEDPHRVTELVAARDVEMGFCALRTASRKCVYREFARDRMVLITPDREEYRAYLGGEFPVGRLRRETFILRERDSSTCRVGEAMLQELGVPASSIHAAQEVCSSDVVKQLVEEGRGVGLVAENTAHEDELAGRLLVFRFASVKTRLALHIVRRKNGVLSPVAQAFYDFAGKYYTGGAQPAKA